MSSAPTVASNSGEPHQWSRWSGWSRRSTTRSPPDKSGSASSSMQPASPGIRSESPAWEADRATSQVSSPVRTVSAISAWRTGIETTKSPSPNEIGAT